MYVAQRYSGRLSPRIPPIKPLLIGILAVFSLLLVVVGIKLVDSGDVSRMWSKPLFDIQPADIYETPVSLFDNFFATKVRVYDEIKPHESLSSALVRLQIPKTIAEKFASAIGKSANLKLLLPGDTLMIESRSENMQLGGVSNLSALSSTLSPMALELFIRDESQVAFRIRAELKADLTTIDVHVHKPKIYKEHALINGAVTNNIYGTIINNGGDAQLVNSFSDIFAWQFDFYKETREGDTYQMIVERNVSEGRFVNFSKVLAAEYVNNGKSIRGFYFESKDGTIAGFFDDKGQSLKNAFLKAPLKLASISSRFGVRFHPVLGYMKQHNGVDYGAPRGTPIMAVANGIVSQAGFSIYNGNFLKIKHMNGYETEYLHASRLGKNIRVGAKIHQGQVIAYVGSTGRATGPHLHFGMKLNGKYVNPSSQQFARSAGIPTKYLAEYKRSIEAMVIALNRQAPDRQPSFALNTR